MLYSDMSMCLPCGSIFYVYYEQYLTMWADTGISLAISLASVFAVTLLFTFDLTSSFIILVTISMIIADIMGLMYWWNISLNAVSLVNLVMVCIHGLASLHLAPTCPE